MFFLLSYFFFRGSQRKTTRFSLLNTWPFRPCQRLFPPLPLPLSKSQIFLFISSYLTSSPLFFFFLFLFLFPFSLFLFSKIRYCLPNEKYENKNVLPSSLYQLCEGSFCCSDGIGCLSKPFCFFSFFFFFVFFFVFSYSLSF